MSVHLASVLEADLDAFPFAAVADAYHQVGKEFVAQQLLDQLVAVRRRLASEPVRTPQRRLLAQFLDTALDKHDGRYDYRTYLALPLLQLPDVADPTLTGAMADRRRDELVTLVLTDLLRFETAADAGTTDLLPAMRPGPQLVAKRIRLALRVVTGPARRALGLAGLPPGSAAPGILEEAVQRTISPEQRLRVQLSLLPVATLHDEFLFVRCLQAYEVTFAAIAVWLGNAVDSLVHFDARSAADQISHAAGRMSAASPLFSLLATMQPKAFSDFRRWTTGASAIQSDAYKLVESLCRTPDETRVDSLAYLSVPGVRRMVLSGQATVSSALRDAAAVGMPDSQVSAVRQAMDDFEAALLRWRNTHYQLARRMLGDAVGGTGDTEGVPYLEHVRRLPVFEPAPPTGVDHQSRADAGGEPVRSEPDTLTWSGESW